MRLHPLRIFLSGGFFLIMLFSSCNKKIDYSAQIKTVDSLKSELLSVTNEFNRIDSAKISSASLQIKSFFDFINPRIKDTISRQEAMALSEYKSISKALAKYSRTKKELARYYEFNVKQLNDLKFDLEQSNIEHPDSATKYLNQELMANKQLTTMMKLHNNIIPDKLKKFDSLKPIIVEFARKISNGESLPSIRDKKLPE